LRPLSFRPISLAAAMTSFDRVYKTTREKYDAAIQDIRDCYERGQPVLVGTTSIENSEIIAQLLKKKSCHIRC
jgi:preprotein translocase subunit SecA